MPCLVARCLFTESSACFALPSFKPMPAMTQMPCDSMKILPSSHSFEPIWLAEVVVGAQEPFAVPAVLVDDLLHLGRFGQVAFGLGVQSALLGDGRQFLGRRSTNRPAMKTDSATLPSLLVVVWNDWPGVSEKQFRFRQSFQSARPMSGRPCGPRRSSV